MKESSIIFILFILYTLAIIHFPSITACDINLIQHFQELVAGLPLCIPDYIGKFGYTVMIALPLGIGISYFFFSKMYKNIIILCSAPIIAYLINTVIKMVVHRPRPPYELQLVYHPHSFSFVSRHTFVSACLWGMVMYFACKYCKNSILRNVILTISSIWIILIGVSRIWIGVHYPTDVIGAYILASVFLIIYIRISDRWC